MAQTHVLAAHLENHGDLIADPDTPSDHLIVAMPVRAFERLWEGKNWVLVNRNGEPVEDLEHADPERQDEFLGSPEPADKAQLRKERVRKFTRSGKAKQTAPAAKPEG